MPAAEDKSSSKSVAKDAPAVVVTRRAIAQEPDKQPETDMPQEEQPKQAPMVTRNKVIAPISPDMTTKEEAPAEEPEVEQSRPDSMVEGSAIVDAVAGQAGGKKKAGQEEKEEIERIENIHRLIAEKKYNLPISTTRRTKNARGLAVFLLLVILVIGAYLAVDAGLIPLDVTLPADFIKN